VHSNSCGRTDRPSPPDPGRLTLDNHLSEKLGRRLLRAGMVLFLFGVCAGLSSGQLENPRVGLTSTNAREMVILVGLLSTLLIVPMRGIVIYGLRSGHTASVGE
jgi:hypothetical protein